MGYRYLKLMVDEYNALALTNPENFKKAVDSLKKNEVALAHGFCTRCQQVTYYVRDYSDYDRSLWSHICSECGTRFFLNGYKGYIAMKDIDESTLANYIKNEIKRLNSIPVQKKILRDAIEQFIINLNAKKYKISQLCDELDLLKKSIV